MGTLTLAGVALAALGVALWRAGVRLERERTQHVGQVEWRRKLEDYRDRQRAHRRARVRLRVRQMKGGTGAA